MKAHTRNAVFIYLSILIFTAVFAGLICPPAVYAQDNPARSPEVILQEAGATPTVEAVIELFINTSEWDEAHSEFQEASRQALIDLGVVAVPTMLQNYLSSIDIRRRVELDTIIGEIGNPSASYLITYLTDPDSYTRRHTAYLLGNTAYATSVEDLSKLGPFPADVEALQALVAALATETDWHVIQSLVGSIGMMRDPAQIDLLGGFLSNEEEAVRLAAVVGLGKIPAQAMISYLIRAFNDTVMSVRQAAVLAISTETIGNLAFEALIGASVLSPGGKIPRLCAFESLVKYLDNIKYVSTPVSEEQRMRAYDSAKTVILASTAAEDWQVRGYAVDVIGYTWFPDATAFLQALSHGEKHPFVLGKINNAIDRIAAGRPEPSVE